MGKQAPPPRVAPSLAKALRDARGALPFATGTSLNQCRRGVPFGCRSGVPIACRLTGLTALEPLGRERAAKPADAIAHPAFEPSQGESVAFSPDCRSAAGRFFVADGHLEPLNRAERGIVLPTRGTVAAQRFRSFLSRLAYPLTRSSPMTGNGLQRDCVLAIDVSV